MYRKQHSLTFVVVMLFQQDCCDASGRNGLLPMSVLAQI
jgi:hypothetical protein